MYSVDEEDGEVEVVLVLSNATPSSITVQIRDVEGTAKSEYVNIHYVY